MRAALDLLDKDPRPRGLDWKRLETNQTSDHREEGHRWPDRLGY